MSAHRALLSCAALMALAACGDAREVHGAGSGTSCTRCHGSADNAAPPLSPLGATATSDPGVGAHQRHLQGGALRNALACDECHVVPDSTEAHVDGEATITFGALASANGVAPAWSRDARTCAAT